MQMLRLNPEFESAESFARNGEVNIEIELNDNPNLEQRRHFSPAELTEQKVAFLALVTECSNQLKSYQESYPAQVPSLKSDKKKALSLKNELLFICFILKRQYELDLACGGETAAKEHEESLLSCTTLIQKLREDVEKITPEAQIQSLFLRTGNYLKYLWVTLYAWLAKQAQQIADGDVDVINNYIGIVSERRAYVAYSGMVGAQFLELISAETLNDPQAHEALTKFSPRTVFMYYFLYLTRIFLTLNALFRSKKTNDGRPALSCWEQFQTQWPQRKFIFLNDFIAIFLTMMRFSEGTTEQSANLLGVSLLLVNVFFSVWRHLSESTEYNHRMESMRAEIKALKMKKMAFMKQLHQLEKINKQFSLKIKIEDVKLKVEQVDVNINALEKKLAKTEVDWKFRRYQLIANWAYYLGLAIFFSVMCFPGATSLIMKVLGSASCFALNIANAAVTGKLDIARSKETHKQSLILQIELIIKFEKTDDLFVKKNLFIELMELDAESQSQDKLINYKSKQLKQQVLTDASFPTILFIATAFMSLGTGIGLVMACYGLLYLINKSLESGLTTIKDYEFDEKEFCEFDPQEKIIQVEKQLKHLYSHKLSINPLEKSGFFKSGTAKQLKQEQKDKKDQDLTGFSKTD